MKNKTNKELLKDILDNQESMMFMLKKLLEGEKKKENEFKYFPIDKDAKWNTATTLLGDWEVSFYYV